MPSAKPDFERSLVLIKPDGVQRGLIGRITQRLEDAGLKIIGLKMIKVDREFASKHYFDLAERRGEKVHRWNVDLISEGTVVAMVLQGIEAIEVVRKIVGPTEPKSAPPGTIRGDFAHASYQWGDSRQKAIRNLIHASSNQSDAAREIKLWFSETELNDYSLSHQDHVQ